ncbi:hypothetical protein ABIE33_005635 [Ensifer sp. 4252]
MTKPDDHRGVAGMLCFSLYSASHAFTQLYRPLLDKLSWAMARTVDLENDRSRYDCAKSTRELGLEFRPVTETLRDEVPRLRTHGFLPS